MTTWLISRKCFASVGSTSPRRRSLCSHAAEQRPLLGGGRMICLDGPAGAGKTTLSEAVAAQARDRGVTVHVVHLDDTYAGWDQDLLKLGGRLRNYLVGPMASGHSRWLSALRLACRGIRRLGEGSSGRLAHPRRSRLRPSADRKPSCHAGLGRCRSVGHAWPEDWPATATLCVRNGFSWKEREGAYFSALGIQEQADILVVTTNAR